MPHSTELNDFEKGQIIDLSSQGLFHRQIAGEINRSKTVKN